MIYKKRLDLRRSDPTVNVLFTRMVSQNNSRKKQADLDVKQQQKQ